MKNLEKKGIFLFLFLQFFIGFFIVPNQFNSIQQSLDKHHLSSSLEPQDNDDQLSLLEWGQFDDDGGSCKGVDIHNGIAYIANSDQGLEILNISQPDNPRKLSVIKTKGIAFDVTYYKGYAYVSQWNHGLGVIDVRDPYNPKIANNIKLGGYTREVFTNENILYVATDFAGVYFFDITNPNQPLLINYWLGNNMISGIAVLRKFVCLAAWNGGLEIIDLTFPSDPTKISTWNDTTGVGYGVDCQVINNTDLAFVAYAEGGLKIINFTNPYNIQKIGEYSGWGTVVDVIVENTTAYLCSYTFGLVILDVSDPTQPELISYYDDDEGNCIDVAVEDSIVLLAEEYDGINILSASPIESPSLITKFFDSGLANKIVTRGNLAFVADRFAGLEIFDISNYSNPQKIGQFNYPNMAVLDIVIKDNIAILSSFDKGLHFINISQPDNPILITKWDEGYYIQTAALQEDYLYLGTINQTIVTLNISNLTQIETSSFYNLPLGYTVVQELVTNNDTLFMGSYNDALVVFDITNRSSLTLLDENFNGGIISDILIDGDKIFAATREGIEYYDISNRNNTVLLSSISFSSGRSMGLIRDENLLFIAADSQGIRVVDISDPLEMEIIGEKRGYKIVDLCQSDQFILAAAWDNDLMIFALDSDDDGITDHDEITIWGTNPNDSDTDGDGLNDGYEITIGLDPLDESDGVGDPDNDGLTNGQEFLYGTQPFNNDTDADGMPDGYEVDNNLNPTIPNGDSDPDKDNLTNYEEYLLGTNPVNDDTDGDGAIDGIEIIYGTDPTNENDNPAANKRKRFLIVGITGSIIFILAIIFTVLYFRQRIKRNIEREKQIAETEDEILLF
jgi:hypothetical protein